MPSENARMENLLVFCAIVATEKHPDRKEFRLVKTDKDTRGDGTTWPPAYLLTPDVGVGKWDSSAFEATDDRMMLVVGDITKQRVDAIVNAANTALTMGNGVCGAIFNAAGTDNLQEACGALGGCETGDAKITPGFDLSAHYIIHTPGPVYKKYPRQKAELLLASCYEKSLRLAREHEVKTIAFPCLSTGIYGYPKAQAADIAVSATAYLLATEIPEMEVRFVAYGLEDAVAYVRFFPYLCARGSYREFEELVRNFS